MTFPFHISVNDLSPFQRYVIKSVIVLLKYWLSQICVCFCVSGLQLGRWGVREIGSRQQRHPKIPQNHSRAAVQQSKSGRVTSTDGLVSLLMLRCHSLFNTPGCGLRVCWIQAQRCCDKRWRALHVGWRRLWPTRFMSGFPRTSRLYDFDNYYWLALRFVLVAGHSDSQSRNMPTLVKDISGVGQVACGSSHTIAVAQDGRTVWSFGGGDNGL